jgi:autotransporter translocation and assembly factor TamB
MLPPAVESRLPLFLKELALDIALKHRLPLKVDNNIALLEVQPDMVIKGTLDNPVLLGQARVDSGEVFFQRKTFLVEKGVISFTNPYKTEPYIDITAGTTIKQWRIELKASGTPDQLDVELRSEPEEEQADILSLLVFGKPTREMNAATDAAQTPAQMLAAFLAPAVADNIKTMTGLDIVEISTEDTGGEDAGQSRITLGSKVSERLTLKYSIKSGQGGMIQESASEYRLTENATVSGFQDNRGIFGGRLIYRFEFR